MLIIYSDNDLLKFQFSLQSIANCLAMVSYVTYSTSECKHAPAYVNTTSKKFHLTTYLYYYALHTSDSSVCNTL